MNETLRLLERHRSIRKYRSEPIPRDRLEAAMRAAQRASTSSNVQAYSIIRVTDRARREALVELTGGQPMVAAAAEFLIICGDQRRHRLACAMHDEEYEAQLEAFLLAVVDASLFAQNLAVAFESMGYGMCYVGGLRNDLRRVHELFEFPDGVLPLYGFCVGVPDSRPTVKPRLPLEAILFEDDYPTDDKMRSLIESYDEELATHYSARDGKRRIWSRLMATMFSSPRRGYLGAFYRSLGASME
ncbi:MAG: oxygen-insensitive NADPH nitroreductase [Phycisphaerales bacterium]